MKKMLSVLLATSMMTAAFAGTAMAAEDREKITKVKLNIDSSIEAGDDSGDVTVTADSSFYEVTDVDVVNDEGDWESGDHFHGRCRDDFVGYWSVKRDECTSQWCFVGLAILVRPLGFPRR